MKIHVLRIDCLEGRYMNEILSTSLIAGTMTVRCSAQITNLFVNAFIPPTTTT